MGVRRVLIVEDEADIREILEYVLEREGLAVESTGNGEEGLLRARSGRPDLILLDLMLPGLDGLELCRRLKADEITRSIPVVMVTAKGEEADVVAGLELGADDYVPKPFSPRELAARVKAVLRRTGSGGLEVETRGTLVHGDLRMDPNRHAVTVASEPVEMTATEFRILYQLLSQPGRVFTRQQVLDAVQGPLTATGDRSIDAHVRNIRRKLGAQRQRIETVRGIGYRFAEA